MSSGGIDCWEQEDNLGGLYVCLLRHLIYYFVAFCTCKSTFMEQSPPPPCTVRTPGVGEEGWPACGHAETADLPSLTPGKACLGSWLFSSTQERINY